MMMFSTPANRLLFQKFAQANNKENIKAQIKWSFVRGIHCWLDCCVAKTSQTVVSYTILNTDGHIWTNLFIIAYYNTDMTVLRKYITSQWRYVRDMASQITGNSGVVFRLNKGDIKAQHYWPFVRGIHRYLIIIIIITNIIIFIIIITLIVIIIIIIFNYHHNYHYFLLLLSLLLLSLLCVFVIMIIVIIITIIIIIVVVLFVIISIIIIIMSLLLSL